MFDRLVGTAVAIATVLGLGQAAQAALFVPGSTFQVQAQNSPGTFTENVSLTPGATLLDGGELQLTLSIVPDGVSEWLVFSYATADSSVLSQQGQNWAVNQVGLDAAVAVDFTAAYVEFSIDGTAQTPTASIFGGYSIMADPVPGETGTGLGASGFSGLFPAGPLPALGAFISPWSFLNATGIDSTQVDGYTMALKFAPQVVVDVPEPASLMLFGSAMLGFAAIRRRRHS